MLVINFKFHKGKQNVFEVTQNKNLPKNNKTKKDSVFKIKLWYIQFNMLFDKLQTNIFTFCYWIGNIMICLKINRLFSLTLYNSW